MTSEPSHGDKGRGPAGAHASLLTESGGVHSAALASVLKGSVANLTELEMREVRAHEVPAAPTCAAELLNK